LNVAMHVDDSARGALVPSLILQPLVENAIKHGTSQLAGGAVGEIEIRARRAGDELRLSVVDNGPPARKTSGVATDTTGVGLSNTSARLRQMYGAAARVSLTARPEGGVVAEVVMPFREKASPGSL
jgi:LytS/YehU family sensor histidine kinase